MIFKTSIQLRTSQIFIHFVLLIIIKLKLSNLICLCFFYGRNSLRTILTKQFAIHIFILISWVFSVTLGKVIRQMLEKLSSKNSFSFHECSGWEVTYWRERCRECTVIPFAKTCGLVITDRRNMRKCGEGQIFTSELQNLWKIIIWRFVCDWLTRWSCSHAVNICT
jgi:hypothetical protein